MNRKLISMAVAVGLLQGCGWNAYKVHENAIDEQKKQLDQHMEFLFASDAAEYIDTPPEFLQPKRIEVKPTWLTKDSLSIHTKEPQTLRRIMSLINSQNVKIFPLLEGTTGDVMINLDVKDVSLEYILDVIKAQTDMHYDIRGRNIVWSEYETRTFKIATLPGTREYGMGQGAEDTNTSEDSTSVGSSAGNVKSGVEDYAKLKANDIEFMSSIEEAVKEIVGSGQVLRSDAGTNLTVVARPSKVQLVDRYINQSNADLNRQIVLMVKTISFQSNSAASAGVNWNLVKDSTYGALSMGNSWTNAIDTGSFLKFSPSRGGLSGSDLLISALEKQGKVSVTNELPVTLLNYRPSRFVYKDNKSYVANVIDNESNETGKTSTELEKDTASDGYTMFALGKILDDRVLLQLSSELQALKDFDLTAINDIEIKSPQYTQSLFAQTNSVRFGETLIANAFTQTNSNSEKTGMFGNWFLGGNAGETTTIQTIVTVTPTLQ